MDQFLSRFAFIFLIYAVVTSGYINEILSCQMRRFLRDSRWFRHVIGICMVFVFIMLEGGWSFNPDQDNLAETNWSSGNVFHTLAFSIGIYGLFLTSSKSRLTFNLVFFSMVLVIYFVNTYRNYLYDRKQITEDQNKTLLDGTKIVFFLTLVILAYGLYDYAIYQRREHPNDFKWDIFFLGSYKCKSIKMNGEGA